MVLMLEYPDTWVEGEERFLNKRAQYYWFLREEFTEQRITIDDDSPAHELSRIGLDFTRKDKIKIQDKDQIRKKLQGLSPTLLIA